jgi:hypothetical protein
MVALEAATLYFLYRILVVILGLELWVAAQAVPAVALAAQPATSAPAALVEAVEAVAPQEAFKTILVLPTSFK